MASSKKSSAPKPPKGRPISTSAISQPSLTENLALLSAFSENGKLFALVTMAVDKHRLRIYNAVSGRAVAEYTIQTGRVSSLIWSSTTLPDESQSQETSSPSKKRKKRKTGDDDRKEGLSVELEVVVLGLSDGTILFFSPSHSKIVRTLAHASSNSSILSLASDVSNKSFLWTSSSDSSVHLWDIPRGAILRNWKNDDRIPYTSLAVRPSSEGDDEDDEKRDLLAAHHHIRLLTDVSVSQEPTSSKPKQVASFTGHASSIKVLRWAKSTESSNRFFSAAEGDRFVYIWDAEDASTNEKPAASISLDSDVRTIGLNTPASSTQTLVALSSSGKVSIIPVPTNFPSPQGTSDKPSKIHSLLPRSTLESVTKGKTDPSIIDLVCPSGNDGSIRVVRLVNGIRPVFDVVRYLDEAGNFIPTLALDDISDRLIDDLPKSAATKRYAEPSSLGISSGIDPDLVEGIEDSITQREVDGSLQVDLAELSLGQRLAAVTEAEMNPDTGSDEDEVEGAPRGKSTKRPTKNNLSVIPANSLTRTLIQALHSSDSRLLEMCLAHSDSQLIRNTVRRLPPQLAIPLINACVERLGRGARAANMKGRGGGASSQRGTGLVTWVNTVLAVHTGHLMTIPDLVARLSGLHATLTARLSLHESLLSLSGRLDTVLSQVEYRAATTPASLSRGKAPKAKQEATAKRYVEGETESEEDGDMEVEVEEGSEDGSVEDIELGGESGSEDSEDDESDDSEGGNDFIDDEAEEDEYSDEEEEDSE